MSSEPLTLTGTESAPARLSLSVQLRQQLVDSGIRAYPGEACGLLVGRVSRERTEVVRIAAARNLEARPDRYELDPEDFLAADLAARADSLEIVGIWHSHPDHPAVPSPTDLDRAWHGFSYLIVAINRGEATELRSWRLVDERFSEEFLEGGEPLKSWL